MISGRTLGVSISTIMITEPKIKDTQQEAFVVFFQYREYKNGARNDPASAPQEIPINCAIKVTELLYWINAIIAEIAINTTTRIRMRRSCFLSLIFLIKLSFKKSIVNVELEAMTSEDSVDTVSYTHLRAHET